MKFTGEVLYCPKNYEVIIEKVIIIESFTKGRGPSFFFKFFNKIADRCLDDLD